MDPVKRIRFYQHISILHTFYLVWLILHHHKSISPSAMVCTFCKSVARPIWSPWRSPKLLHQHFATWGHESTTKVQQLQCTILLIPLFLDLTSFHQPGMLCCRIHQPWHTMLVGWPSTMPQNRVHSHHNDRLMLLAYMMFDPLSDLMGTRVCRQFLRQVNIQHGIHLKINSRQ